MFCTEPVAALGAEKVVVGTVSIGALSTTWRTRPLVAGVTGVTGGTPYVGVAGGAAGRGVKNTG